MINKSETMYCLRGFGIPLHKIKSKMDWQIIIVSIVILCAIAYVIVRIRRTVSNSNTPCCNCGCCPASKRQKCPDNGKYQCEQRNNNKNLQE